ncbi:MULTISPECIES: helix-turn-helix domain-containing protein [unclassified Methanosarcina]|uniref:helix-turn-helix domain-containing protein n=1 Tax=unclassified Methanosarcina TaxID=2644672 RepID=UPI000615C48A|nr:MULTISPECIES: helix-turn-helix domain-containing protein [unclassified Methanosarcina]AKB17491.1 Transcriptional regulator, TrmB family [Methanosarcina sp. WWM596]AKB20881.1 Transcriptional regulator, TrmB family [Methanosarcina sp. WH1]
MYTDLIGKLQKVGFTENKAKIYIGRPSLGEVTTKDIHEFTTRPRLKIYATLKSMSKKKCVVVIEGTPAYFRCIGSEQLTKRLKDEFLFSLNETLKELNFAGYGIKRGKGKKEVLKGR